jgi:hypothetical protein
MTLPKVRSVPIEIHICLATKVKGAVVRVRMSGEKATLTHDRPHAVVSFDGKDTVSIGRRQYSERRRVLAQQAVKRSATRRAGSQPYRDFSIWD